MVRNAGRGPFRGEVWTDRKLICSIDRHSTIRYGFEGFNDLGFKAGDGTQQLAGGGIWYGGTNNHRLADVVPSSIHGKGARECVERVWGLRDLQSVQYLDFRERKNIGSLLTIVFQLNWLLRTSCLL